VSLDLEKAKGRLKVMLAVDAVAVLLAVAAAVGSFGFGIEWMAAVFVAALAAGFAAQIWFIAGLRRADKGV
jgi:hypothetical protein